jgi:hypothetical protein
MTDLPPLVQRAPTLFYIAAMLFFIAGLLLNLREANSIPTSYDETMRPLVFQAVTRAIYQSALDAVFLAANGVLAHILLAIWRNGAARGAPGDDA